MSGLLKQFVPDLDFFVFLDSKLVVDPFCYLLWVDIVVGLDAVLGLLAVLVLLDFIGHSSCFVQEEGSLHLVLALLVTWRCGLVRDVPAMVVYIPGVAACISRLRVCYGDFLVFQALSDHEPVVRLVLVVHVVLESARGCYALGPLGLLCAQDVLVDLVLHNWLNRLGLRLDMALVKEGMLGRVVELSVFDTANLLGSSKEVGVSLARLDVRGHDILASA